MEPGDHDAPAAAIADEDRSDAPAEPQTDVVPEVVTDVETGVVPGVVTRTETRLRRLAGRKGPYSGPLIAVARGWVSRDSRHHAFAARFLDFAVLTPEHLVLCSTGFFTRRPRRRVFREPLARLQVVPFGAEPIRVVRVFGSGSRPIRLEMRQNEAGLTFVRELLACTKPTVS